MIGAIQQATATIYTDYRSRAVNTDSVFSDKVNKTKEGSEKVKSQRGTVMAAYYAEKPQYKGITEGRVKGGYAVLSSAGVSAEDLENMSMEEFKGFIGKTIQGIPHHSTRPYDEETVLISEEGWESMKKDPDYAAYVIGLLKEDRSTSNPFFGMGDKGAFITQTFGASPADYHGYSFSKIYGGTAAGARAKYNAISGNGGIVTKGPQADLVPPADYNLWEEQQKARRKKRRELIEEEIQAKYEQKKRIDTMYNQKFLQQQFAMNKL